MGALISLFAVIVISLVVVRIGGIALAMTGLSRELAMLQAQSAFTGVGFTTAESESVVNHLVRRRITKLIQEAFREWAKLDVKDYAKLLEINSGYTVSEFKVKAGEWLSNKKLKEVSLGSEGVLVLGIRRANGKYIGAPFGDTTIKPGDTLTSYGPEGTLEELSSRYYGKEGDEMHTRAVQKHEKEMEKEQEKEENS